MNNPPFFFKALFCWLIPVMVLFGSLSPVQKAQAAASPCTADYFHQGLITADETWCAGATHYMTGDVIVQPGVTLTIAAGVTVDSVEAAWSKYLTVQGHLDINGTLSQPVLLTRSINYPIQNWSGLYFDGSQGDGSGTINYAIIEHAGSNFLPSGCTGTCGNGQTAVFVKDLSVGKQVTINNSTFRDNVSKGLYVVDSTVNVTNTAFSQNKYPILIDGASSVVTYSGNTFSNNAYPYYDNVNYAVQEDAIFINPGALMGHNFSLPVQTGLDAYIMWGHTTIPAGVKMTVDPGVTVRMDGDKYLTVQGHLDALGTQALPIRFTGIPGSDAVNHNWGGLYFEGTAGDGSGTLSHVTIERGGSNFLPPSCVGTCGTAQTAVFIKDLPANKQVNISSSIIENSLSKGLYVVNSPTAHVDGNLIKGGRVGAHFVSNMTVNNLAVIDQVLYGIVVESGYNVDARHLTIARAGQIGLYTGGTSLLKNSILSHNALAVKAEGSGQATLDTNLADGNTIFKSGTVSELHPINGSAAFEADGYHIQATSEAVGNGLPGLSAVDIDGNMRPSPSGSLPDLGADEISAGMSALPRVLSSLRANPNPTNLASVNFTVTFSESVAGVDLVAPFADFSLTTTGVIGASIISVTPISGATYTITVNTGIGNGTIRLNVVDNNSIVDAGLNPLGGAAIGDGDFTSGETYTINRNIETYIGGVLRGSYLLGPGESTRQNYVGVDSGPVKVVSTDGTPIVSAIREAWAVNGVTTSFFQMMGLPQEQLSDTYVFPGYNNVTLNEQLRISNVDTVPSTVTVTIGGVLRGTYPLAAGEAVRINYAGLDSGPVIVQGTTGVKIISAIREAWAVGGVTRSFVQLMGLPKQQLSDKYVFPGYNNVTLNEQLRIGNVDSVASTVTVTIGGVLRGTYILQPNEAVRVNYAGVDSGPVIVQGTAGVKIISAIREAWAVNGVTTSFAQLMGLPSGQLSNKYVFPGYNNVTLNDQLRIGNVDSVQTTVTVTIGGVLRGSYTLQPNEAVRVNYAGLDSGPVVVEGSAGVKIISAVREAWAVNGVTTSFTQLMGLPFEQLSSTFWFPAYNNVTLNEQLRIAVP